MAIIWHASPMSPVVHAATKSCRDRGASPRCPCRIQKFLYYIWRSDDCGEESGFPVALYICSGNAVSQGSWPRSCVGLIYPHVRFNSSASPVRGARCGKPIVSGRRRRQICPWRCMGDFGLAMPGEFFPLGHRQAKRAESP